MRSSKWLSVQSWNLVCAGVKNNVDFRDNGSMTFSSRCSSECLAEMNAKQKQVVHFFKKSFKMLRWHDTSECDDSWQADEYEGDALQQWQVEHASDRRVRWVQIAVVGRWQSRLAARRPVTVSVKLLVLRQLRRASGNQNILWHHLHLEKRDITHSVRIIRVLVMRWKNSKNQWFYVREE